MPARGLDRHVALEQGLEGGVRRRDAGVEGDRALRVLPPAAAARVRALLGEELFRHPDLHPGAGILDRREARLGFRLLGLILERLALGRAQEARRGLLRAPLKGGVMASKVWRPNAPSATPL
jgi:hypothetical protein